MGFQQQSMWLKTSFALITIGFVVWLSAGMIFDGNENTASLLSLFGDISKYRAYVAFMIIGLITYYGAVLVNFLCIFVPETENHPIVMIVGVALGILAGISGIIVSAIGNYVPFSDRIAWALICAFISAAFLFASICCGGRGGGGGGSGGGIGSGGSAGAHQADFQPQQQVPA